MSGIKNNMKQHIIISSQLRLPKQDISKQSEILFPDTWFFHV